MHRFSSFTNLRVETKNGNDETDTKMQTVRRRSSFMTDAIDKFQLILQSDSRRQHLSTPQSIAKKHTSQSAQIGIYAVYPFMSTPIDCRDLSPLPVKPSNDTSDIIMESCHPSNEVMAHLPLEKNSSAIKSAWRQNDRFNSGSRRNTISICTLPNASTISLSSLSPSSTIDQETEMVYVKVSDALGANSNEKQTWSLLPSNKHHGEMQVEVPSSRIKDNIRKFGHRLLSKKNSTTSMSQGDLHFASGLELVDDNEHYRSPDQESFASTSTPTLSYSESMQQEAAPVSLVGVDPMSAPSPNLVVSPQIVVTTPSTEYDVQGAITFLQAGKNRIQSSVDLQQTVESLTTSGMSDEGYISAEVTQPSLSFDVTHTSSLDVNMSCNPEMTLLTGSRTDRHKSQEAALLPWSTRLSGSDDGNGSDEEIESTTVPIHPLKIKSKKSTFSGDLRSSGLHSASKKAAYACTILKFHPQLATSASFKHAYCELRIPRSINKASILQQHPTSTSHHRNMRIGLARSNILRRLRNEPVPLLVEKELEWFVEKYLQFFIAPEKLASRLARRAAESSMEALAKSPVKQGKKSSMAQWASRPRYEVRCGLLEDRWCATNPIVEEDDICAIKARPRLMPMELSKRCKALAGMIPIMKEEKNCISMKKTRKKGCAKKLAPLWKRPSSKKGSESQDANISVDKLKEQGDKGNRNHYTDEEDEEDVPLLVLMKRHSILPLSSSSNPHRDRSPAGSRDRKLLMIENDEQAEEQERPLNIVDDKLRRSHERHKQQDRIKIYRLSSPPLPKPNQEMSRCILYEMNKEQKSSSLPHARASFSPSLHDVRSIGKSSSPAAFAIMSSTKPTSNRRDSDFHPASIKPLSPVRPILPRMPRYQYDSQPISPTLTFQSMPMQIMNPYAIMPDILYTSTKPALYPSLVLGHNNRNFQQDLMPFASPLPR